MRFDCYCGSFGAPMTFRDAARLVAEAIGGNVRAGVQRRRYSHVLEVHVQSSCVGWLAADPANRLNYFEIKGDRTPDVVSVLRAHVQTHTVCRADICEDFGAEDAFDRLREIGREHKPARVSSGYDRLPDDPNEGRTWSCGRRGGSAYMRLYEKGKQRQFNDLKQPYWVRVEFELRPQYKADKKAAASMTPAEILGTVPWCRTMAQVMFTVGIPLCPTVQRLPHGDRTFLHVARCYQRLFSERLQAGTPWEQIGAEFEAIWREDARNARELS